ncbi:MAG: heme exporter protein CcmD [Xanthobacteraceae bacterium]|jgi:heme exporter protein D
MDLGAHAAFIVAAYAISAAVVAALVVWVIADHRAQVRTLAELEASGVRRRSEASRQAAQ